jgi:hypothetical protein
LRFRVRFFFAIAILYTRLGYRRPAFFARDFALDFAALERCFVGPFGRLRFQGGDFFVAIVAPSLLWSFQPSIEAAPRTRCALVISSHDMSCDP